MTPQDLADDVARIVARAQARVGPGSIGAEQYHVDGQPQRFETMPLEGLIEYATEETLDLVNYGVMLTIRLDRIMAEVQTAMRLKARAAPPDTAVNLNALVASDIGESQLRALLSITSERDRQDAKWGLQRHSWPEWIAILTEEVGEAAQAAVNEHWHPTGDLVELRKELVQVAAVTVQIIEHIDEVGS